MITDLGPFEDARAGRVHPPAQDRRSVADRWWASTSTVRQLVDTRLRIVLAVIVAVLATATIYFSIAKSLSPITSLYFTVVTLSTVGYGDVNLQNDPAHVKLVGVAFIMLGASVLAIFFAFSPTRSSARDWLRFSAASGAECATTLSCAGSATWAFGSWGNLPSRGCRS